MPVSEIFVEWLIYYKVNGGKPDFQTGYRQIKIEEVWFNLGRDWRVDKCWHWKSTWIGVVKNLNKEWIGVEFPNAETIQRLDDKGWGEGTWQKVGQFL